MRSYKTTSVGRFVGAVCVALTAGLTALNAGAQTPAEHATSPPLDPASVIDILDCVVYPEGKAEPTADCAGKVRTACGRTAHCSVPIGLALTDGRQIDGDARTWKKVRIHYRCGQQKHVEGPYIQDDHATVILSCGG
jgi:hypothetical protein